MTEYNKNIFVKITNLHKHSFGILQLKFKIIIIFLFLLSINIPVFAFDFDILSFYKDKNSREGFYYIGKMIHPRSYHSAIKLNDGRVFIAGGCSIKDGATSATTEIFDPKTKKSQFGPSMKIDSIKPLLFLLKDGNVLIKEYSWKNEVLIEIYNPNTNTIKTICDLSAQSDYNRIDQAFYINDNEIALANNTVFSRLLIYDTNTKKITKLKTAGSVQRFVYIDTTDKGELIFLYDYKHIIKIKKDVFENLIKNETNADIFIKTIEKNTFYNEKNVHSFYEPKTIYIKDANKVAITLKNCISLFDLQTHKFENVYPNKESKNNNKFFYCTHVFDVSNKRIWMLQSRQEINPQDMVSELNLETLQVNEKTYTAPNYSGEPVKLNENSILYTGGNTPFGYESKKIYIWERNIK